MDPDTPVAAPGAPSPAPAPSPSIFRWTLGFLLVGFAWGFTTPFMRKAALARQRESGGYGHDDGFGGDGGIGGASGSGSRNESRSGNRLRGRADGEGGEGKGARGLMSRERPGSRSRSQSSTSASSFETDAPPPSAPLTASSSSSSRTTRTTRTKTSKTPSSTRTVPRRITSDDSSSSTLTEKAKAKIAGILTSVLDTLRRPAYAVPLLVNVTGSIWFFLLVGQAELSLTVPITNSLAFLFTVLGEWFAEGKVISKGTWLGMSLVLAGIALCVHSKL